MASVGRIWRQLEGYGVSWKDITSVGRIGHLAVVGARLFGSHLLHALVGLVWG